MDEQNIHPEVAEGYIATVIREFGNSGFLAKLELDWNEFRASQFYETCVEKYGEAEVERTISSQKRLLKDSKIDLNKINPNIAESIKAYVNAGLAIGLMPDWNVFCTSKSYDSLVKLFSKKQVDNAVQEAKKNTEPLGKTLG